MVLSGTPCATPSTPGGARRRLFNLRHCARRLTLWCSKYAQPIKGIAQDADGVLHDGHRPASSLSQHNDSLYYP